jgi:PIN domain nuclease of toxin-antitoxin system
VIEAYALPQPFHRDPADRLLAATARRHELTLVTADERILAYPAVATIDVRV